MKPRGDDYNKEPEIKPLSSLKELMGDRAYYSWLADKLPSIPTTMLKDKKEEEYVALLSIIEIKIQQIIYQRVQYHQAELKEFFSKIEAGKKYENERSELIAVLNELTQNDLKRIVNEINSLDEARITKDKLNQILHRVDQMLKEIKLEITQLKLSVQRIDEVINKYDERIQKRIETHLEDAQFIANSIPKDHHDAEASIKQINQASADLKSGTISISKFKNNVYEAANKFAHLVPQMAVRLDKFQAGTNKTEAMIQKKQELVEKREILVAQIDIKENQESQLQDIRTATLNQVLGLQQPAPDKNEQNAKPEGSTSSITNLLAKAAVKEQLQSNNIIEAKDEALVSDPSTTFLFNKISLS
jgi:hypothetical protein